jgi:hypothetical protein
MGAAEESGFYAIRGVVDGKGERGTILLGFAGAASGGAVLLQECVALPQLLDPSLPLPPFRQALGQAKEGEVEAFARYVETQLLLAIKDQRLFSAAAKSGSTKNLEAALVRYLQEQQGLRAVVVAKMNPLSEAELGEIQKEKASMESEGGDKGEESGEETGSGDDPSGERRAPNSVLVPCQSIMDPIHGVGASTLKVDDIILVRLPDDSIFFGLFKDKVPGFDGVVSSRVTGVRTTDTGAIRLDLILAEGVLGMLTVSPAIRVKVPRAPETEATDQKGHPVIFVGLALAAVILGALLFLLR